jgi:cadmium resistance protein CadD (predicted permease)
LGIQVLAITIVLGADDLGVYIPLFTTLTGWEVLQMLLVFIFGTAILCFASYRLTRIEQLTAFIETYERFIIGIIFVAIGVFVMVEYGTLTYLYKYVIH